MRNWNVTQYCYFHTKILNYTLYANMSNKSRTASFFKKEKVTLQWSELEEWHRKGLSTSPAYYFSTQNHPLSKVSLCRLTCQEGNLKRKSGRWGKGGVPSLLYFATESCPLQKLLFLKNKKRHPSAFHCTYLPETCNWGPKKYFRNGIISLCDKYRYC